MKTTAKYLVAICCVLALPAATCLAAEKGVPRSDIRHAREIVERAIAAIVGMERYGADGNPKDELLTIVFPGLPLDISDLSFSTAKAVGGDIEELERAFRFAKLTCGVMIRDSAWRRTGVTYEDLLLSSGAADRSVDLLTSPAHNDTFYPVFPNPAISDTAAIWTVCPAIIYRGTGAFVADTTTSRRKHPVYRLACSITRIRIERRAIAHTDPPNRRVACISQLIVVRGLSLTAESAPRQRKQQPHVTALISAPGPHIVGYIYEIIEPH